jgi:hypothetical protein
MSFNYSNSADTARRLLTQFGRNITHRVVTGTTYNPATETEVETVTDNTVKAADFSVFTKLNGGGNQYFNGVLVQQNDRFALVSPDIALIEPNHRLIIDGVIWQVMAVDKLAPAGVLVLWKVLIRK